MKTIGKIILSVIAIAVLFVPVFAVQQIEARSITHALAIEGLYVNGTAVDTAPMTNETMEKIEYIYPYDTNATETYDSALRFRRTTTDRDIYYRDLITYLGNGSYTVTMNYSDEPDYTYYERDLFIPLDMNVTDLIIPDFVRITSTYSRAPSIFIIGLGIGGGAVYGEVLGNTVRQVADDEFIYINTLTTRSWLNGVYDNCGENTQVFLRYEIGGDDPDDETFTYKIQTEIYEGADAFTWNDETLYIVGIIICDTLLIGAIVFASDPIDISIEKPKKWR